MPADQILSESEESLQNLPIPIPFDLLVIAPTPASGSTTVLIADQTAAQVPFTQGGSPGGFVPTAPTIPYGCRGIVDGIFPYLEGNGGTIISSPRIPGNQVVFTWTITINGRPDRNYGKITSILAPWNGDVSPRPLIHLRSSEQLGCTCTNTDPNGLYAFFGIRITGTIIPIETKKIIPASAHVMTTPVRPIARALRRRPRSPR